MKFLLADDHTLFRDALVHYIERSVDDADVFLADDLHGALECLSEHSEDIDLVLLDFCMPGMDELIGLQTYKETYPDIPVAMMSGVAEPQHVQKAMELGASGFFPKTLSGRELVQGLLEILNGKKYLPFDSQSHELLPSYYKRSPHSLDRNIVNGAHEEEFLEALSETLKPDAEHVFLTPREQDVMIFLMQGSSNKEIARALDLKLVTVKLHVRGIMRKLGAQNRTQAALIAKNMGLCATQSMSDFQ